MSNAERMKKARCQGMSLRKRAVCTVLLVSCCAFPALLPLAAQAQETDPAAPLITFPAPIPTGVLGVKQQAALNEINAHIHAVSAVGWQDLEGTETITFAAGDTHSASLYLLQSTYSRLDIVMDAGTRSLRVASSLGAFQDERGNQGTLLELTPTYPRHHFQRLCLLCLNPSIEFLTALSFLT